jgi:DNA polymerase-3 subunit delta'
METAETLASPPWQDAARAEIAALIARGAQAVLLHGQAGTGKLATALAIAQDLLCEDPGGPDQGGRACGRCDGCRLMRAGSHPDLRVVVPEAMRELVPIGSPGDEEVASAAAGAAAGEGEGEGKTRRSREIRIEQVRDLGVLAEVSAHRGGRRVVVLGPAESLNLAAGNAALKLLEEPPERMVFLLVADAVDDVLATIRSRCLLIRGGLPSSGVAIAWLAAQGIADGAERLAQAGGAPFVVLRQAGRPALDDDARMALLGMLRCGSELPLARVAAEVPRTVQIGPACDLMQRWAWDVLARQRGAPVRYHLAERETIERLAATALPSAWLIWLAQLERIRADADHPLNARLTVEAALLGYQRAVAEGA